MSAPSRPIPGLRSKSRRSRRYFQAAEHDSLGQVDRHRPRGDRRQPAARPRRGRSATTSRSTAIGSSTTATSSFFTSRRAGRTRLDRRAVGVPYQDRVEHHALGRRGRRACAAAATPGSFRTRRFRSRDRDRPHPASFPPKVPEQCLRLHGTDRGPASCSTRFSAWETAPSPRCSLDRISSGSKWTSTT